MPTTAANRTWASSKPLYPFNHKRLLTSQPICDIPGERLQRRSFVLGEQGALRLRQVKQTFVTKPNRLLHLTYQGAGGTIETLSGTGEHPFYVVGKGKFLPA